MSKIPRKKKEILVAVSGLTPQVITETLYYLTQKKKPPISISEIYVLTTEPGKKLIERKLLEKKGGAFYSFCREYGINSSHIKFNESTIALLKDDKGKPLPDIKTPKENRAVANSIIDFVKGLTSQPHTRLHCSIAGGRKTQITNLIRHLKSSRLKASEINA
jgi:CRISPR-associated protein (TIGR02584 family)